MDADNTSTYRREIDVLIIALLVALMPVLSGCDLIEGIFKIGFWAGIILVVIVIAVIWALFRFVGSRT